MNGQCQLDRALWVKLSLLIIGLFNGGQQILRMGR